MRLTEFWRRMEEAFGGAYAHSLAHDHILSQLGGRSVAQALAAGEEVVYVWRAVVKAFPDRVPARLR